MQEQTLCNCDVGDDNLVEMHEEEPLNSLKQDSNENFKKSLIS